MDRTRQSRMGSHRLQDWSPEVGSMAWNGKSQVPTIWYGVVGKLQFYGPKYISRWGSGFKYYFSLPFSQQKLQIEGHLPARRKWYPSLLMLSKAALSGWCPVHWNE